MPRWASGDLCVEETKNMADRCYEEGKQRQVNTRTSLCCRRCNPAEGIFTLSHENVIYHRHGVTTGDWFRCLATDGWISQLLRSRFDGCRSDRNIFHRDPELGRTWWASGPLKCGVGTSEQRWRFLGSERDVPTCSEKGECTSYSDLWRRSDADSGPVKHIKL